MLRSMHRRAVAAIAAVALGLTIIIGTAGVATAATSPIDQRYNNDNAVATLLGPSTGPEYAVAGGLAHNYRWGSLFWSSSTGVKEVHGAIRARYFQLGGPGGTLGFPTTDERAVFLKYPQYVIGAANSFQRGELVWNQDTNKTFRLGKAISDSWADNVYPYLGMPAADEVAVKNGRKVVFFGGAIYSGAAGTFWVHSGYPDGSSDLYRKYEQVGGPSGPLGLPTSDYIYIAANDHHDNGRLQRFQAGAIYQRGVMLGDLDTQAHEIHGAIYSRFLAVGGIERLGFPTSDEHDVAGGRTSTFEHGAITWNRTTQATTVTYY